MHLKQSYDQQFVDLYFYLKSKYGEELFKLEGIGDDNLDLPKYAKKFFTTSHNNQSVADKSSDPNANISDNPSVINFSIEASKPGLKLNSLYMLWKYAKSIYNHNIANGLIESALTGDVYINDSTNVLMPYCYNYSTLKVAQKGLPGVNKIHSDPPKHLLSFIGQIENFVCVTSNQTLGASGIADVLVTLSIYMDKLLRHKKDTSFAFATEDDCWRYLKENIIRFIYNLNQNFRSNQSPFTNVSLYDSEFLKEMIDSYKLIIDDELYEANIEIVQKILEIYLDSFNEILRRTPCTFPVTTSCTAVDENYQILDESFLKMIAEKNIEFGFINIYAGKSSTLSSCCRLRSEKNTDYFNSIGGTSTEIGSLGVCTINLPRLAYKYKDDQKTFFEELKEMVWKCQRINNSKRHILKDRIDNNNLPLYTFGFMNLDTQYCTVGVNGIYECVTEMGYDVLTEEGVNFQLKIIDTINKENDAIGKKYGIPTNCEQIPGESVSVKLAQKDDFFGWNDKYALYSNQFIPLIKDANMLDRIRLQGIFDKHFSGGSILHLNVGEKIVSSDILFDLMKTTISQGVIYFAINYVLTRCAEGHMGVADPKTKTCVCGSEITDQYTRVVGFFANTKNFHYVRRESDFPNRRFYRGVEL
jgi:ribonucleoside-triphosphate reductase (formate)